MTPVGHILASQYKMESDSFGTTANRRNIPRIGSGGPAGTFDHVETARSALPIGVSVRVRATESIANFSKEMKVFFKGE